MAKVVVALRRAVGVLSVSLSVIGHVVVVCFVVRLVLLVWFAFAYELLRPPLVGCGGVVVQRVVAALVFVLLGFVVAVAELALAVLVGCAAPVLVVVSSCSCSLVFCECCIGATHLLCTHEVWGFEIHAARQALKSFISVRFL